VLSDQNLSQIRLGPQPDRVGRTCHSSSLRNCCLVLQGGGALGAYQAGVYEALSEAGIHPNWIAGMPIGAIICGDCCRQSARFSAPAMGRGRQATSDTLAFQVDLGSARGEFPRDMFEAMTREKEIRSSFYDTLKSTLERLVDFDRLNAGEVRFSVGAVNIRTGRGRTPSVRST
jgi:NTE family protein